MKIFAKLLTSFTGVALICALVGGLGWYGIYHTRDGLREVSRIDLPAVQSLGLLAEMMNGVKAAERTMVLGNINAQLRQHELAVLEQRGALLDKALQDFDVLSRDPNQQTLWTKFKAALENWRQEQGKLVDLVRNIQLDDVQTLESTLATRHLDHINWVRGLEKAVTARRPFNGQLDPKLCGLGKWMASYHSDDGEFLSLLDRFDRPHQMLHGFGTEINQLIQAGNFDRARHVLEAEVKPTLAGIEAMFEGCLDYVRKDVADLKRALKVAFGSEREAFSGTMNLLDRLQDYTVEQAGRTATIAESEGQTSQLLALFGVILGVVSALACGFFIARSISDPTRKLVAMIREIENGHLDQRLHLKRRDEIGEMARAMDACADAIENEMVANLEKLARGDLTFEVVPRDERDLFRSCLQKLGRDLNGIMAGIHVAGEQIAAGSAQVSDASQSLSQGATESASSLEEITASLNEMTGQVRQNAENANQANSLSDEAQTAAENGNAQMQEMVTAMGEIADAGQNISKIIKVIDEIAFQTNLLALNAAVEAARAGQHGKGFAVVAEEVRNLAGRSARAARETAELIEGSVNLTEKGSGIAAQTAEALGEIVQGVTKVSDLVAEIAVASNEQAEGIAQVNQGLTQIDQVTQQNTANAEESAAASEELSSQAAQLRQMLARFSLKTDGRATAAGGRTATPGDDGKPDKLVKWNDRYATRIPIVDQQHRRLLDLINQLYLSMKGGGDKETVKQAVDQLVDYTRTHFSMEENLLREHGYPDFASHKQVHDRFVDEVLNYREKIRGGTRLAAADIFNFLKGWLISHIEQQDRDGYAPFLRTKGIGETTAPSAQTGSDTWDNIAPASARVIALDDGEFGRY